MEEDNSIETTKLLNELKALMDIHAQERTSHSRSAVEHRPTLNQNSDHAASVARRNRLSLSRRIQTVRKFLLL
jgi:hypothetical protein